MKKSYEIDMTKGSIFPKIVSFSFPLMLTGMLQLLFNSADVIVVGRFVGHKAMAAVGSTGTVVYLLVNLFLGLAMGVNVCIAQSVGAGKQKDTEEVLSTAFCAAILSGVLVFFLGNCIIRPMLILIAIPDDVFQNAEIYLRYYFFGVPFLILYDFLAAIFRAVGDTKRPLYTQIAAGVINVLLNLFFVIELGLGVKGVAIATSISESFSALVLFALLLKEEGMLKLKLNQLRIYPKKLYRIFQLGIPAGVQGMLFSISNLSIQSAVNSFGSIAMAGATVAGNIEGFVYIAMNSVSQGMLSFTSQNLGAKQYKRINAILKNCILALGIIAVISNILVFLFSKSLAGLFTNSEEVVRFARERMFIIICPYCIFGLMDILVGGLRGFGYSFQPMLISLIGICFTRVFYVLVLFPLPAFHGLKQLYFSYPVTWVITVSCLWVLYKKVRNTFPNTNEEGVA